MKRSLTALLMMLALFGAHRPAQAGIPVIDVAALAQLIQQVTYWSEQIRHMVTQVNQLRATYESISGQRGMGQVLAISDAARNYLPEEIGATLDAIGPVAGAYAGVAGAVQAIVSANAVLPAGMLEELTPEQRELIERSRQAAASLQQMSRTAYANTSRRFGELRGLITAIGATDDQKGILELAARIQAEQAMLVNEQTKLTTLHQVAQAQELARAQQVREHSVRSVGTFRSSPARTY